MEIIKITGSRLRKYILRIFFTNHDQEYYVRQLSRITESPASNIQKELHMLATENILLVHQIANIKFYRVNKDYFLYTELASIIRKTEGVEGLIKRQFSRIKNVKYACLYGDFANQSETKDSQIKLLVIGNPDQKELEFRIKKIENRLLRKVEYQLYKSFDKKIKNKIDRISPKIVLIKYLTNNENKCNTN